MRVSICVHLEGSFFQGKLQLQVVHCQDIGRYGFEQLADRGHIRLLANPPHRGPLLRQRLDLAELPRREI